MSKIFKIKDSLLREVKTALRVILKIETDLTLFEVLELSDKRKFLEEELETFVLILKNGLGYEFYQLIEAIDLSRTVFNNRTLEGKILSMTEDILWFSASDIELQMYAECFFKEEGGDIVFTIEIEEVKEMRNKKKRKIVKRYRIGG